MKKESVNKITGFLAIGLIFSLLFLMSWLFNRKAQQIEGPHIFYKGDTIESLTINITGNKKYKTYKAIDPSVPITFNMKTPDGQDISIIKHEKIVIPKHRYTTEQKIIAISDIEGDFDFLKKILQGNSVIDDQYNWIFDKGHLVIVGDIFDRGKYVTECLWLLYKLEEEARRSGGQVHVILGNHEIMALQGDHRYIHRKYKRLTSHLKMDYKLLYGTNTEIGRWLRSKNSIEIIGRTLFVHGGISPELINRHPSIDPLNATIRTNIDNAQSNDSLVMGKKGPLWYRGYIEDPIEDESVQRVLTTLDVDHIAVGHTVVPEISPLYNNKVYALDAKRINKKYQALLIDGNTYYITNSEGLITKL